MSVDDPLFEYAAEVLSFGFKDAAEAVPPDQGAPDAMERMVARCLAAFARSGRKHMALLGLGSGFVAGALATSLPQGALVVCEQDVELARSLSKAGRLGWRQRGGGARLALDDSPWALLFLLDRSEIRLDDLFVLPNPELDPARKARLRPLETLLCRSQLMEPPPEVPAPRLSVAAIISPAEPDLQCFFAQLPPWLHELVVVWDAESLPSMNLPRAFPVWQTARPLARDFATQRNAMLAACTGDWVFSLDADERLSVLDWAALPLLCAYPDICAWRLPRVTVYPTPGRALAGYGLWPDVQLRLYRRAPGLSYVGTVHERLTGLAGRQALSLDLEIEHLSRLRKGEAEIRRKLEGFDAAGAGSVHHTLSAEYPSVPRSLLASHRAALPRGLLLPAKMA